MKHIDCFDKEYAFLSNFYETPVWYEGMMYQTSEAAFQAAKTLNLEERVNFQTMLPGKAKREGRKVTLRSDWESIKDQVMYEIVKDKFTRNEALRQRLCDTRDAVLVEGNYWNDRYWGVYKGEGLNKLGNILMRVRQEIHCEG